jgi:hypothetical protein
MPSLDYGATGHMQEMGLELGILDAIHRHWVYCRSITSGGSTFFKEKVNSVYINTGGSGLQAQREDLQEARSKDALDAQAQSLADIYGAARTAFEDGWLRSYISEVMGLSAGVVGEPPIIYEYNQTLLGSTGEVRITRRGGIWGAIYTDMVLNGRTITGPAITIGAITGQSTNIGQLTEPGVGGSYMNLMPGRLEFHCVDDTVGRTRLTCDLVLDEPLPDGTTTIPADNQATVGQFYEDGPVGLTWTPQYVTPVESGDNGNIISSPVWTNPGESGESKGVAYLKVTRKFATASVNPPSFLVEWFNDASRTADHLVASRGVEVITGTVAVSIPGGDAGNLAFNFDAAAAATHLPSVDNTDADIVLDLKVPREGDVFTKTITSDLAGLFAQKLIKLWRVHFPVVIGGGGGNITDSLAANLPIAYS